MEGRQQEASFNEGPLCAQLFHRCYFHPPTKEVLSQDSYQRHLTLHPHTHSLHPAPRSSLEVSCIVTALTSPCIPHPLLFPSSWPSPFCLPSTLSTLVSWPGTGTPASLSPRHPHLRAPSHFTTFLLSIFFPQSQQSPRVQAPWVSLNLGHCTGPGTR